MLPKRIRALIIVVGLIFGFSLGMSAYVNQFKEMLEVPGCVLSINNSLKEIPEEVKLSNDKVRIFCEKFNEYQKQVVSKKKTLTLAQMEKQRKKLTKNFEALYLHDKAFRAAFIEAVGGKSHASVQSGIGNSKIRCVPGSHSGL